MYHKNGYSSLCIETRLRSGRPVLNFQRWLDENPVGARFSFPGG